MKKYTIKYEDTSGQYHIEEYTTDSFSNAIKLLKHPIKKYIKLIWVSINSVKPKALIIN